MPGPYVGQPYPAYFAPPAAPPPAPPKKSRPGLVILLVAIPLALIIAAGAALVSNLSRDKQLSDTERRVTITVPGTWSNDTTDDAGQRVEQGKRGEESFTVPHLETSGTGSVLVFIDDPASSTAEAAHKATVDEECELNGCISRGQAARVEVSGRPGTEQILRQLDQQSTVVLTLQTDTLIVTLLGYTADEDREAVQKVMRSVVIAR